MSLNISLLTACIFNNVSTALLVLQILLGRLLLLLSSFYWNIYLPKKAGGTNCKVPRERPDQKKEQGNATFTLNSTDAF